MQERTVIQSFAVHDRAIDALRTDCLDLRKVLERMYDQSLTYVMMRDVLFELLQAKGMFTREQFDAALGDLAQKTKEVMEAEQNAAQPRKSSQGAAKDSAKPTSPESGPELVKPIIP